MAKSCKEIWTNTNFLLKFTVMICVLMLIGMKGASGHWFSGYGAIVTGYENTCLTIIIALFITYIFIDPTKFTELCLLVVALIKLLVALIIIIIDYTKSTRSDNNRQESQTPNPSVDSSTQVAARMGAHSEVNKNTIFPSSSSEPTQPLIFQMQEPSDSNLYSYAALTSSNTSDNSSGDIDFYVYLVINIVAVILIIVDIFLRAKK